MHRSARVVAVAVVALGTLSSAGCGSSSGSDGAAVSASARPYVTAVTKGLLRADDGAGRLTAEQARCVAPRWVEVLRPARLRHVDVTPADLSGAHHQEAMAKVDLTTSEADSLVDAYGSCDVDTRELFIDTLSGGRDLPDTVRACLADALGKDLVHQLLAASMAKGADGVDKDPELSGRLFEVLGSCPGAVATGP